MSYADRFEAEIRKIILEEIEREKNALGNSAALDYSDYKRRVGKLEGLALLDYVVEEARKSIYKN